MNLKTLRDSYYLVPDDFKIFKYLLQQHLTLIIEICSNILNLPLTTVWVMSNRNLFTHS